VVRVEEHGPVVMPHHMIGALQVWHCWSCSITCRLGEPPQVVGQVCICRPSLVQVPCLSGGLYEAHMFL
jgi:hypothetical protein